jgi:hypothetical protein
VCVFSKTDDVQQCYICANDNNWPSHREGLVVTNTTACTDGFGNGCAFWASGKDGIYPSSLGIKPESEKENPKELENQEKKEREEVLNSIPTIQSAEELHKPNKKKKKKKS